MSDDSSAYRDGYFARDGLRLHFRDYPGPRDGPPIVCLHGLTRNARDFATFADRMSPRFRVLVLDFRGRGESEHDPVPARYIPATYANDVIAMLDHVGVADAIFVGTSLGGIVAMLLAVVDEDRIAAAILNDIGPDIGAEGIDRIRGYVGKTTGFSSWAEAAEAARTINRGFPTSWESAEWETMARRLCRENAAGLIQPDYDPAIAEPFETSGTSGVDMWPLFDALAVNPVLVIRGTESDLLSAESLKAMAQRSPNVSTVTVPGVGHAPDLDEPEALFAIDAFLARFTDEKGRPV